MEIERASEVIIAEAKKFVHSKKLGVISTVSPKGKPESATVLYLLDDNWNLFFITRNDSRKAANLQINKYVSFVVGTDLGPTTMQMNGEAEQLTDEDRKQFVNDLAKHSDLNALYYGPFLNLLGINFLLFKVKITWARYLTLNMLQMRETYYQILSENDL